MTYSVAAALSVSCGSAAVGRRGGRRQRLLEVAGGPGRGVGEVAAGEVEFGAPVVALALEDGDGVADDAEGRELAGGLDLEEEVVGDALERDSFRKLFDARVASLAGGQRDARAPLRCP